MLREADLRRHLINEVKVDDSVLEDRQQDRSALRRDAPRAQEGKGIDDFQLYYALKTIARLGAARRRSRCAADTR